MPSFCGECGAAAAPGKFCGECGKPYAAAAAAAAPAPAPAAPAAAAAPPAAAGGWQPKDANYGKEKMTLTSAIRDSTGKALTSSSTDAQTKRFGGEFTTNRQQVRGITLDQSLQEIDHAIKHGVQSQAATNLYTPARDAEFGGQTVGVEKASYETGTSARPNNGFGVPYGAAHGTGGPGSNIGGNKPNHGFGGSVPDNSGGAAANFLNNKIAAAGKAKKQVSLTD